jgi:hypothetical protein
MVAAARADMGKLVAAARAAIDLRKVSRRIMFSKRNFLPVSFAQGQQLSLHVKVKATHLLIK